MYPEINKLISLLHKKNISTFLVTNAQFPDAIKSLHPVTQLYVSVDAPSKDALKKVDRPLFRDFWPRFIQSLQALRDKKQRTVYRLTLVKGWNTEEVDKYAELVDLGRPDFIEIKGVTFCGDSGKTGPARLTMENVPWHAEVIEFAEQMAEKLNQEYAIASEHEHSNCILLASKRFLVADKWLTWIDYDRFHQLIKSGQQFSAMDYMAETPDWAVYGAKERGFDPMETRWFRKDKGPKDISGC